MSETMPRITSKNRHLGEMTDFDMEILGHAAVRVQIPVTDVQSTLESLRKLYRVTERAIYILENHKLEDSRHALFDAKSLLRQCAMSISRAKRRRV